jgi:hypothetical protein
MNIKLKSLLKEYLFSSAMLKYVYFDFKSNKMVCVEYTESCLVMIKFK